MTYFVHKSATATQPQAGYERISMYMSPAREVWVLWGTDKTAAEINAEISGELLVIGEATDDEVLAVYPDIIAQKVYKLRAEGARRLTELNVQAGGYLEEEREFFQDQKDEATEYLAWVAAGSTGDAPITPVLSGIVSGRPDLNSVADIAALVKENIDLLKPAGGTILGKQQGALVAVYTAADLNTALNVEMAA